MIYRCPKCGKNFSSEGQGIYECPSCGTKVVLNGNWGVDWDRPKTLTQAFILTVKDTIASPIMFFEAMRTGKGKYRPWFYMLIVMYIVFAALVAFQAGLQFLTIGLKMGSAPKQMMTAMAMSLPVGFLAIVAYIVIIPIFVTIAAFVKTAIYHVCLSLIGEARGTYEDTFRVVCYASTPQLFQAIPFLGGIVGGVWGLVLEVVGLKVVHRTTYGYSALAVFLPMILCCGLGFLVVMAVAGGMGVAAFHR